MPIRTIKYDPSKNEIIVLDQTKLPSREVYKRLKKPADIYKALKDLTVRGAPLIGIAAAYGVVLSAFRNNDKKAILSVADSLGSARPTAVNLAHAIARMKQVVRQNDPHSVCQALLREARAIELEEKAACRRIGAFGAHLIKNGSRIMVHCNAGMLATSGMGTALAVLYQAKTRGTKFLVYSCETRPLLQGARLTTWELVRNNIETYCICDSMAAHFMLETDLVLAGADRIARNGDTANKIGTHGLAVIAREYRVPFYIAAPTSSFDLETTTGAGIPIEYRGSDEIRMIGSKRLVAAGVKIRNPAFDITPARFITGIITEKGIIRRPSAANIARMLREKRQ